ncbi:MAG: hypothetical protein FJ088_04325 [Deltaproteobacteria bacterium]|nr:hypothetical protein [Deltaproteobacteria bacterium]
MATEIGEPVKVMALFDPDIKPVKFRWHERVYPVKDVTYTWRSSEGEADIVHFSVTDGASVYELSYNKKTMKWRLEQVE